MATSSSGGLAINLPVFQMQGVNVIAPAAAQTFTGTAYGTVTGLTCNWSKVKANTRIFVQICGCVYMSGLLASLPAGMYVGVAIGGADYDILGFNFNQLGIPAPFAGQRIISNLANGTYTPTIRIRNTLGTPHTLNFDTNGYFSLAIQEMY